MTTLCAVLALILRIYFYVLLARLVFDWIQLFARSWRPRGVVLVVAEVIYTLTDPPLKAVRKVIPPLRVGAVAIDLSFFVVALAVSFSANLLG